MLESALREALLNASGKKRGVTAGFDCERILVPSLVDRERLLVLHRLVADLLAGRSFDLVIRLVRTDHFGLQLAVLRGTVLARALVKGNGPEVEFAREGLVVDEPPHTLLAALELDSELCPQVVNGYRAYIAGVWRNPDLRRVPAVDVVVRLLAGLGAIETKGAALAAATVYRAQLSPDGLDDEALYHEQLALMAAFIGADSVSFQDGHLRIP